MLYSIVRNREAHILGIGFAPGNDAENLAPVIENGTAAIAWRNRAGNLENPDAIEDAHLAQQTLTDAEIQAAG